jgi:hypothetical protein
MGFTDEVGIGGGKPILKFNKEARYVKRGSEEAMNDQEFVAKIREARAGYIKFNGNDEPERRLGSIYPKDEAPSRCSLGDADKSLWRKGKFSDVEDPWTAVVEIPLQHRETGEEYLFAAQSKTSIGAAMDFLSQSKRVPDGYDPVIRLGVGSFKSRFGQIKKPVLSIVGKVPNNGAVQKANAEPPFSDSLEF